MSWEKAYVRDRTTGAVHLGVDKSLDITSKTIRSVCGATLTLGAISAMSWPETRKMWKLGTGARVCSACQGEKP